MIPKRLLDALERQEMSVVRTADLEKLGAKFVEAVDLLQWIHDNPYRHSKVMSNISDFLSEIEENKP